MEEGALYRLRKESQERWQYSPSLEALAAKVVSFTALGKEQVTLQGAQDLASIDGHKKRLWGLQVDP